MSKPVVFYRCVCCTGVVAPWDIQKDGSCPSCGGGRVRPTNLTLLEKFWQVLRRPAVWKWEGCDV